MLCIRCTRCGHATWWRDGLRYCVGCGTSLTASCQGCDRERFLEDRFCAYCGVPAEAPAAMPIAPSRTPVPLNGELEELRQLAQQAVERAAARADAAPPVMKRHFGQADIDAFFGAS